MTKHHDIQNVRMLDNVLEIKIDGIDYVKDLSEISPKIKQASKQEKESFEVSSSGYGIHWPLIDEDLAFDSLFSLQSS